MLKKILLCILMIFIFSSFTVYAGNVATTVNLEVNNVIIGDAPHEKETFIYLLKAKDSENPMPKTNEISIDGRGTASFDKIKFTSPGLYEYQVVQNKGTNKDYTYDETIYEVSIYIKSDDKAIFTPIIKIYKNDSELKSEAISFENNYTDPNKNLPQTGDNNNIGYLISLMFISLVIIYFLYKKLTNTSK